MKRRQLLQSFSAPLLVPSALSSFQGQSNKAKPNIVWIMADDMGWGDPGCYGQKVIKTPNIDRLASEGTRFTDAYAGCTVCAPSRSVLMTGMHMGHTSVRSNPGGVPLLDSDQTVAMYLKQAGYRNGMFGKWGLGDIATDGVPWKKGFDEFCGFLHQVHAHYQYPEHLYFNDKLVQVPGNANKQRGTYANDFMVDHGLRWLDKVGKSGPFFGYFPLTIPHWEPVVPEEELAPYASIPEAGPWIDKSDRLISTQRPRATYAGMVARVDRYVGQILAKLKELGVAENTLVFFTSDNGGHFKGIDKEDYLKTNGPFRGYKTTMYEGGLRVPMIARMPGRIPANRVSPYPWSFCDFLPTALATAGMEAPKGIDGFNVWPTLEGKSQPVHDTFYWELPGYDGAKGVFHKEAPKAALRQGDWKIVRPEPNAALELYNLKADIGETKNLAAAEPQRLSAMERLLLGTRTEPRSQRHGPHPWQQQS
ncbi:MAG: arylsulfatase [Bryobacter sp.]